MQKCILDDIIHIGLLHVHVHYSRQFNIIVF